MQSKVRKKFSFKDESLLTTAAQSAAIAQESRKEGGLGENEFLPALKICNG
ncbi:MAG: hypothetical protein J7L90_03260 [Dehalococcoidia bacterium]|nr:hypothetical protein [Dehalococcoidia bacterium]